ncbi:glycosyltransferase [Bacillus sp. IITD106]|nr:glycosyltransferase [Bacillus sp. IITD106]
MKIAYIAQIEISKENGVLKKVADQVEIWSKEGNEVKLFVLAKEQNIWEGLNNINLEVFELGNFGARLNSFQKLVDKIEEWNPDLVYLRFMFYLPPLKKLLKNFRVVVELNTDDIKEFKITLSKLKYYYHIFTRKFIFKYSSGVICVTNEIARTVSCYNKPTLVIGNGINLSQFCRSMKIKENREDTNIVFIGTNNNPWHGIERIKLIADRLPEINFYIIGYDKEGFSKKEYPENMLFLGFQNKDNYERHILAADVAIGSMALYKLEMNEACPLKVREYLAYGIPTIIGYKDTDFMEGTPFLLELNNEPGITQDDVNKIKDFIGKWKYNEVGKEEIKHLDINYKERKRLAFFNSIIKGIDK